MDGLYRALSRTVIPVLVVSLGILLGGPAQALDPFEDARRVFNEGEEFYRDGKYGDAAERYQAAYRLIQSPLMFYNIAQARRLQYQKSGNYRHLVEARNFYQKFLDEAKPAPSLKAQAEANLATTNQVARREAVKFFNRAEESMRLGKFEPAIEGYEASYALSQRAGLLFNLAQAQRKQFAIDGRLARLARAEDLLLTYQRTEKAGLVDPATIEQILSEIREQRATYHRKREAEARSSEPSTMRDARSSYQNGDGEAALAALDSAEKTRGNPRIVLLQLYRLRGQAAALAGKTEVAVEAFKKYLALEPAADGTGIAEVAADAFKQAKAYWKGKKPLTITHLPPGKVAPQKPVDVPIKVTSDPLKMVASRELNYRQKGSKQWRTIKLTKEQVAKLPKTPSPIVGKSYNMEYYIRAVDGNQAVLDSLGKKDAPLIFVVTTDAIVRPPPVYKRWWFWAAIGAVAAGTITTIAIINDDGLPDAPVVGDISQALFGGFR